MFMSVQKKKFSAYVCDYLFVVLMGRGSFTPIKSGVLTSHLLHIDLNFLISSILTSCLFGLFYMSTAFLLKKCLRRSSLTLLLPSFLLRSLVLVSLWISKNWCALTQPQLPREGKGVYHASPYPPVWAAREDSPPLFVPHFA